MSIGCRPKAPIRRDGQVRKIERQCQAQLQAERAVLLAQVETTRLRLEPVERALAGLAAGRFGVCQAGAGGAETQVQQQRGDRDEAFPAVPVYCTTVRGAGRSCVASGPHLGPNSGAGCRTYTASGRWGSGRAPKNLGPSTQNLPR